MNPLTRQEREAYESGHWHDRDPKGSVAPMTSEDFRELYGSRAAFVENARRHG